VIRGTRVTVRTLLASLAEGATLDEIVADFSTLIPDDIRAVIAFAASSVGDDLPLGLGSHARLPIVSRFVPALRRTRPQRYLD